MKKVVAVAVVLLYCVLLIAHKPVHDVPVLLYDVPVLVLLRALVQVQVVNHRLVQVQSTCTFVDASAKACYGL